MDLHEYDSESESCEDSCEQETKDIAEDASLKRRKVERIPTSFIPPQLSTKRSNVIVEEYSCWTQHSRK